MWYLNDLSFQCSSSLALIGFVYLYGCLGGCVRNFQYNPEALALLCKLILFNFILILSPIAFSAEKLYNDFEIQAEKGFLHMNFMGSKRLFPEIWADDDQMSGLMSMIKAREVNPNDYDRKIEFWSDMIAKSFFTIDILKRRFRRGNQLPGSLNVIIQHMLDSKSELASTRIQDVCRKFWGATNDNQTEYVHLPTVQKHANSILEFFRSEYAVDDDMLPEIVDSAEFFEECKNLVANKKTYDVALAELINRGEVTIGSSKIGEEILKFRDNTVRGPIKWTESDASVHDMRRAMSKLEHEIKRLEQKAKKAEQDARLYIRQGDKNHAAHYLRQKKRALKEVEAKDNQYQRLLEMMQQLGRTKQNKQILDVYKAGADAFKATLQRQEFLQKRYIDETMDDIGDAMATAEEIQDAIASGVPLSNADELNKDLEAELDAILTADSSEADLIKGLPDIPPEEPSAAGPAKTTNITPDDSIAARLKRLREAA
ncbi:Excitatory amino acid transporter [Dirofilaria immitis]|nr:Excitatory amino acid transporter [Dirofilaria immitis]